MVTKRLIDIDDEALAEARRVLGTPTMKATVNEALREVVALDRRRRFVARLAAGEGIDLDLVTDAWR